MPRHWVIGILVAIAVISVLSNVAVLRSRCTPVETNATRFPLLFPFYEGLDRTTFAEVQHNYRADYQPLKLLINASVPERFPYAYYFESLNTGAWVGIHEKERYFPLSLRKVPIAAALYKAREEEWLSFSDTVAVAEVNLVQGGSLYEWGPGNYTVMQLMDSLLWESDNTAAQTLLDYLWQKVDYDIYAEALLKMGLSLQTFQENTGDVNYPLSAKEYANVFRSLYYSTWLKRVDSEELLDSLSRTNFSKGIPAGVPQGFRVSHKVAFWNEGKQHHDCGIVYYPGSPYILCIMTVGLSPEDANALASLFSAITYDYVRGAASP